MKKAYLIVLFLLSIGNIAFGQASIPKIDSVVINANSSGRVRAIVSGTGFSSGIVEIDGIAADKTKWQQTSSPSQRLRANDARIAAISSSTDQTVFQVLNPLSGKRSEPFLLNPEAKPLISSVQNGVAKAGSSLQMVIEGRNLFGASVRISGEGVTARAMPTVNPRQLLVDITVAADTNPSERTITVTTASGTTINDLAKFLVISTDETRPILKSINPSVGLQGSRFEAVITGDGLEGVSSITFTGQGVSATVVDSSDTMLAVLISIDTNALAGARNLSVRNRDQVSSENLLFNVERNAIPISKLRLTRFSEIGGPPDIYHMTEVPDGSYAVTQYSTRSLVLLSSAGRVERIQRNSFLLLSSIAFYSREVAYTTCVPTILASRSFRSSDFGAEGIAPGNLGGVSNPRYMLGTEGLISRTFLLSNGGTGEIRMVEPERRSTSRVIASGFTLSTTDPNTRGLEQLAYDRRTRTIYALDSGKGTVVAVDEMLGTQRVLRSGFIYPFGLVLMPNGNLLVSDRGDGTLNEVATNGQLVATYDSRQGEGALRGLFVNSKGEIFLLVDKIQTIFRVSFE